jgi:hypothetical protein
MSGRRRPRRRRLDKAAIVFTNLPKSIRPQSKGMLAKMYNAKTRRESQDAMALFLGTVGTL